MNLKKEDIILGAEDKAIELEYQLFVQLREEVKNILNVYNNKLKLFQS